jgi:hypothetical protein
VHFSHLWRRAFSPADRSPEGRRHYRLLKT